MRLAEEGLVEAGGEERTVDAKRGTGGDVVI